MRKEAVDMMKKKTGKYLGLVLSLTVVCTLVLLLVVKVDVFGQFISKKPYVDENTVRADDTVVTDEGGNQKDSTGTGKEPVSEKVPTAIGKKGSETNPFVLLEIVPDKAMQQMAYLTGNREDSGLDVMQIGIDAIRKQTAWSYADPYPPSLTNLGIPHDLGNWFCDYEYEVYKIGSDEEKEKMHLAEIGQIYSLKINEEDIKAAGYNVDSFHKDADSYINHDGNDKAGKYKKMADFISKYPKLFEKDDKGNEIRDIAREDGQDWRLTKKSKGAVHYEVNLSSEEAEGINQYNYNVANTIQKYPDLFKTDSDGNEISDAARKDLGNWSAEYTGTKSYDYSVKTTEISDEDYEAYRKGTMKVTDLIEKYPSAFKKDANGKEIERDRLSVEGWKLEEPKETEIPVVLDSGYFHYVGSGGDFLYNQYKWLASFNGNVAAYFPTEQGKGDWEYVDKLPSDAKDGGTQGNFWSNFKDSGYYWSVADIEKNINQKVVRIENGKTYSFTYKKDVDHFVFSYDSGERSITYTFGYYGLKTNNILKRSLFSFADQKECDNFQMHVICMTPSELNELAKEEQKKEQEIEEKEKQKEALGGKREDHHVILDMIERADMFYIAAYDKGTDNLGQVYGLYNRFIADPRVPDYDFGNEKELKSFYENDLEWSLCMKILKRISSNKNLPLVFNQKVGKMIEDGVEQDQGDSLTHLYLTPDETNLAVKGSLNNLSKLYLISVQFDMLARKADGYIRTFTEDILPNIKTVSLTEKAVEGAEKGTAVTTGYYERNNGLKATGESLSEADKTSCYYLWGRWTFYPSELGGNKDSYFNQDLYVDYGYQRTYFNTNAHPFRDGQSMEHQSGSDGTDDKNVAIVHGGSNSDTNHSTLIGNTESSYIVNSTMEAAFQIMNRKPDVIQPLTVSVVKQRKMYERISDELVFIDYSKSESAKYKSDKTLYLKVTIRNINNENGIIKSIALVNEKGNKPSHYGDAEPAALKAASGDADRYEKESITDSKGKNPVHGYRVTDSLTFYVPYQLSDWRKGYNKIQFTLQGRIYSAKLKKSVLGNVTTHDVMISERGLFSLK